jgi:predicted HTH transcriptional regulator
MEGGFKVSIDAEILPQKDKEQDKIIGPEEKSSLRTDSDEDIKTDQRLKESLRYPDLNERQREALSYLNKKGRLTRQEYAQIFDISVATAARDLKELQRKGIIKPEGPNGPGRWYRMG